MKNRDNKGRFIKGHYAYNKGDRSGENRNCLTCDMQLWRGGISKVNSKI